MNTEYLTVNNGAKNQEIENLAATLPDRSISVLLLAFFVKTINLGNLPGFVIASNKSYAIRISDMRFSYSDIDNAMRRLT